MHRLTAWGMCTRFEDRDGREMQDSEARRERCVYTTIRCRVRACVCAQWCVHCASALLAHCASTLLAHSLSLPLLPRSPSVLPRFSLPLQSLSPSLLHRFSRSPALPPSLPPSPSLSHPLSPPLQHIKTTRSNTKINKQLKKTYQASSS